jgi:hypothetical protein
MPVRVTTTTTTTTDDKNNNNKNNNLVFWQSAHSTLNDQITFLHII